MVSTPDPSPEEPPEPPRGAETGASPRRSLRSPHAVALALVAAAVLPPVGLAALPGGLAVLGAPQSGIVLVAALLLAPALVGFAVALKGFEAVLARLRAEPGGDYRQVVARVLLAGLILAYLFAALATVPGNPVVAPALLIGALNLAAAWLFLLNVVLEARRSALRRWTALICDVTLLSILLVMGDTLTAALALVYLYIAISAAEHHGRPTLAAALAMEIAAFAAVVAATPFWRERPLLAAGLATAMLLLPAYVGSVLHRHKAAKEAAHTANTAKNRFLERLSDDLRGPLRTIARVGASIDRDAVGPEQWDLIARMRLNARAMLLQLDDMLNYVRIDGGTFAPEIRAFDLHRLANGAVAALRAPAAERGIMLALRIDPQLPYQLRGWPHQFRQIMTSLITNAIRLSGKAKVRVTLDPVALDGERLILRLTVASTLFDNRLETLDEESDGDGRPLGLAVADRLAGLMGGRLAVERDAQGGLSLAVELPFAIDQAMLALPLDLAHLAVLIVSKAPDFVGDLIEPLEAWRGDPRWIGAGEEALAYLAAFDPGARRAVVIVDGRGDVLQALSWTHRVAETRGTEPPYLLFIVDEARIDSVIGLAEGELDGILPAPFTAAALRSALHALRLEPADWFLTEPLAAIAEEPPAPPRRTVMREAASPETPPAPPRVDESVRDVAPPPMPATTAEPSSRRRRQLLVAAGNPANRKILGTALGRAGYIVHFAEDVDEARQGLESRDVDALLLDLTGYAGADYGAARQCRRVRPSLPIIALSGDAPEIAERRARDAGIDAVLSKPVEPRRLIAAVSTALATEADAPVGARGVVTELASHPRFAADAAPATSEGGGAAPLWSSHHELPALQGLINTFRVDAARIVADIDRACGAGDVAAFDEAVQAMHACTEVFGVGRVRDLLGSMLEATPAKLRLQGANFVHRIESELARLDAALVDYLKTAK